MRVLKSWLKDYLAIDISNKRLIEILRLAGLEVENSVFGVDSLVIVAEIKKINKHPDADKLQIAIVFDGKEKRQIVCGAPNIEVGQLVPLALPGAKLLAGEIKISKIRGIESHGMLCAQDELGIGNDHAGIFILPNEYEVGKSVSDYLGADTTFELDVTANRGDCLSHIGVAREIATFENSSAKKEPVSLQKTISTHTSTKVSVDVLSAELCPQYLARVITGVKIGPSPKWMQDRLVACGAKPINNVVDVTNYILLDLGHPMHAFDWDKIKNSKIIVRKAKKNENIITLDGEDRNLSPEMLVIADTEKPIAIAGVMGGKNSEVDENTETIVLEAAEFDPKSIRKTAKALNLTTEASYRFERGVDSGGIEFAINKAANLIIESAGGQILQGIVQSGKKPARTGVEINYENICHLLGEDISREEMDHILRHLGFAIDRNIATVPTWRHDISIWQDLAEEVGRVIGYDKIRPLALSKIKSATKSSHYYIENLKDILASAGYSESMNYPFLSAPDVVAGKIKAENLLEIANPIQPENKYLRPSLIPGLLKNIAKNPAFDPVQIFEIGHTFSKTVESTNLAFVDSGKAIEQHQKIVDRILTILGPEATVRTSEFSRQELQNYKIKKPIIVVSEINLTKVLAEKKVDQKINLKTNNQIVVYRGVSKYPAITRDLAFIVENNVEANNVSDTIYSISELINRVELFDEFSSDKFGTDKKNLAYHLSLQSKDKTLTDKDAEEIVNEIIKAIEKKFSAKLRKG